MHEEIFHFEAIIAKAVQIDQMAWESLLSKLILFRDYTIHPTEVSRLAGDFIGYGQYTSTDVPRNYVLGNYKYGILSVIIYNIVWAMTITGIHQVTETRKNIMFMSIWSAFVFSQAFGSLGAFPSTHVFQFIFSLISWSLFYLVYSCIRLILTLDTQILLIMVFLFSALMIYRVI
ncbi:hypothetical protein OAH85_12600 [Paracoccaceae bacterium]|nr:hypothetical protein [Paracoccaceae bacterium]